MRAIKEVLDLRMVENHNTDIFSQEPAKLTNEIFSCTWQEPQFCKKALKVYRHDFYPLTPTSKLWISLGRQKSHVGYNYRTMNNLATKKKSNSSVKYQFWEGRNEIELNLTDFLEEDQDWVQTRI